MSQWGSAKARRVLAVLLRIGLTIKRESGGSHRGLPARSIHDSPIPAFLDVLPSRRRRNPERRRKPRPGFPVTDAKATAGLSNLLPSGVLRAAKLHCFSAPNPLKSGNSPDSMSYLYKSVIKSRLPFGIAASAPSSKLPAPGFQNSVRGRRWIAWIARLLVVAARRRKHA
jgi:hypothetical protein